MIWTQINSLLDATILPLTSSGTGMNCSPRQRLRDFSTISCNLLDYVKPEGDVEALNKSRLSFFQTALIKQTKHDESTLTQQIWQEITDNELYAYLYAAPIIAVNQNFPT